jgi:hypothetical protein
VLIGDELQLLCQHFDKDNVRLFIMSWHSHTSVSTDTSTNKWIVTTGSPRWHVRENFFMEDSVGRALSGATYKPQYWSHYIHNTIVICPHCFHQLMDFQKYLNSIHHNIHFTTETIRWPPNGGGLHTDS